MSSSSSRPETNLVQVPIKDPRDAPGQFGWLFNGCTPLVFTPRFTGYKISRIVVPTGFDAIMEVNGRIIGVVKPGVYYRPHCYQIAFIVNKQHIPYHFAVHSCPTLDNVRVDIHVDFLFHVADSVRFVYGIAPENMEELLRATQAETVRSLVRTVRINQVRNLRGVNSEDMIITLNEKLNPYGIHIDQVTIANVALPNDIALSLQRTTAFEAQQSLLRKQHMFELKARDDEQALKSAVQERANERARVKEEANRAREEIKRQIAEIENERKKLVAEKEAERDSKLNEIRAESLAECSKINRERERLVHEIMEKGKAEEQKVRLENSRQCKAIENDTNAKLADIRAKIFAVRAEAEKYAADKLKARREYEERIARLQAIIALSKNPNVVISGDTSDNALATLLAANRAATLLGLNSAVQKTHKNK